MNKVMGGMLKGKEGKGRGELGNGRVWKRRERREVNKEEKREELRLYCL